MLGLHALVQIYACAAWIMLGLHIFRQKKVSVVKREPRNSDSVVWTDLLSLIRHYFRSPIFPSPPQSRGLRLSEDSGA